MEATQELFDLVEQLALGGDRSGDQRKAPRRERGGEEEFSTSSARMTVRTRSVVLGSVGSSDCLREQPPLVASVPLTTKT